MKRIIFHLTILALLMLNIACDSLVSLGLEKSDNNNGVTSKPLYIPVSSTIQTRTISGGASNPVGKTQFWFSLLNSTFVKKTKNTDWHLGFWSANNDSNLVIINYSVKSQANLIPGKSTIGAALNDVSAMNSAYNDIVKDSLKTFDFHHEEHFSIRNLGSTSKVYLIKTSGVQVHPVDAPNLSDSVTVNYFLVSLKTEGNNKYHLIYQSVTKSSSGWTAVDNPVTISPINKNSAYQYVFVSFGETSPVNIQPPIANWNLALSPVTLKRYKSNGDFYIFTMKGIVLNCNPNVEIYKVQNTPSNAGAPGPYDPNFTNPPDPALNSANDIGADFLAFNSDSIGHDGLFSNKTQEQIGQYWRYLDMGNSHVFVDRFYILRLKNEKEVYKIRFKPTSNGKIDDGIKFEYAKIATY